MDFKDKEQYAKILDGMSTVAKTYVRISSIKTALTVFLIGYIVDLVKGLYKADTPTNIFPSIHVYNTVGVFIALRASKHLQGKTWIQIGNLIMTVSIILSTVFLKQHSILDMLGAFIIAAPAYYVSYVRCSVKAHVFQKAHI